MKLQPGAGKPTSIPVPAINGDEPSIRALAVNSTGDVFVATASPDSRSIQDRKYELLRMHAGSPVLTPMPGDVGPANDMAADNAGTIYATGMGIEMLVPGSPTPSKIYNSSAITTGLALDPSGSLYVIELPQNHTERGGRVLKLPNPRSQPETLPFTVDGWPISIAVDAAGDVFFAQNKKNIADGPEVQRLTPAATAPTTLTLDGITDIRSITADADHLYINQRSEITKLSLDGKCQ